MEMFDPQDNRTFTPTWMEDFAYRYSVVAIRLEVLWERGVIVSPPPVVGVLTETSKCIRHSACQEGCPTRSTKGLLQHKRLMPIEPEVATTQKQRRGLPAREHCEIVLIY